MANPRHRSNAHDRTRGLWPHCRNAGAFLESNMTVTWVDIDDRPKSNTRSCLAMDRKNRTAGLTETAQQIYFRKLVELQQPFIFNQKSRPLLVGIIRDRFRELTLIYDRLSFVEGRREKFKGRRSRLGLLSHFFCPPRGSHSSLNLPGAEENDQLLVLLRTTLL